MVVANSAQIREMDRIMMEEFDFPGLLLMETAGRKSAEFLLEAYPNQHNFLVLCGPGNNGGDGLVAARYLYAAGKQVQILLSHNPGAYKNDASVNFGIIHKQGVPYQVFDLSDAEKMNVDEIRKFLSEGTIIIDALLGTGVSSELEAPFDEILNFFRKTPNAVVALDMPSGLIGDTGAVATPPLRCEYTLTYQLPKICCCITPAAMYCGKVETLDIGIYGFVVDQPEVKTQIVTPDILQVWYRPRENDTHKGIYGHVMLAGGSKGKGGAVALCARAVTEIGAGLCTAYIPGSVACSFHRTTLENMSMAYGANTVAYLNEISAEVLLSSLADKTVLGVGPGLGNNHETQAFLAKILEEARLPLVLDADALNILAENPEYWDLLPKDAQVVITPHPGEMARLMQTSSEEVQQRRLEAAVQFAAERNIIVVLKGSRTLVADPDGNVFICTAGNPGMASGGAGDVLTGVVCGLVAQGYELFEAAAMGVFVHALSGDLVYESHGHEGVTASKIIENLGASLRLSVTPQSAAKKPE